MEYDDIVSGNRFVLKGIEQLGLKENTIYNIVQYFYKSFSP